MKIVDGKKVIYETKNFTAVAANQPFISREEGGHIMIRGNGNRVKNYIVYERDANGNIVNDEDGNPKIKEQYGPGYFRS